MNKHFTSILIGLLLLCSCTSDEDYTYGSWVRRSDLDGVARAQACSFTIGDKGYICTGNTGKKLLKDLWEYDINGNYWTQCASMPDEALERMDATAFAVKGKGYVSTGAIKTEPYYLNDTWEYDPLSNSWSRKDDFAGSIRYGATSFAINGFGYLGTGYDDNYLKDFYRFSPDAPTGQQWEIVNGYGGQKRLFASNFVIDDIAYLCCGTNNGGNVDDFWSFDGTSWTRLRDISDTSDDDYDDDYNIVRSSAVTFVIDGKGYLTLGTTSSTYRSDYWVYYPESDLWYGKSDDDYTSFEGTSRSKAVAFSTGSRGFVLTGTNGYYFDDVWELLPYEIEEVD